MGNAIISEINEWGKVNGYKVTWKDGYQESFYGKNGAEKARLAATGIMQSMDENAAPIYR